MRISRRIFNRFLVLGGTNLVQVHSPAMLFAETADSILQPLAAQIQRLIAALQLIGTPLPEPDVKALHHAFNLPEEHGVSEIERILSPHFLLEAPINPENRVSVSRGAAKANLVEHGWCTFLIKVNNEAAATSLFNIRCDQAESMGRTSAEAIIGVQDFTNGAIDAVIAESRWLALDNWNRQPLNAALSGLSLEYRILLLYSRDRGKREASLEVLLGDKEQDLGYRSTLAILFNCVPSQSLSLRINDMDGTPTTASLLITDKLNRVYPAQNKRSLPDLWFERQIYRSDKETIVLPAGEYTIQSGRGPEYLTKSVPLSVAENLSPVFEIQLERWIKPSKYGYYSGDTHIHAAGCSHYESPSEGVTPEVMYRQIKGEALDLGDVLTWGPGYYYQKRFFTGHVDQMATTAGAGTLRYDVEVSGFPSSHCGHLVLLQLTQQDYPGTKLLNEWPSWNGPILQWAKKQGALAGYAHSGHGLTVDSTALPNYFIPPYDSMGANEYIADVTHDGLVAFISGCDTRPFAELNIWYHVLNCGFRTVFVGETDFPCLSDEGVGGGRTYIQLDHPPAGDKGYAAWIEGLQSNRSYFGDGRSHIFDFAIEAESHANVAKTVRLNSSQDIEVSATVCARLEPEIKKATEQIRTTSPYDKPYWHLERARVGASRKVAVELIVNGFPVDQQLIEADGSLHPVRFNIHLEQSSWIALRILPSSHTNPHFALLYDLPIRASKKSAQWCRTGVDVCWQQKSKRIRPSELAAAAASFEHARVTYDRIISECSSD